MSDASAKQQIIDHIKDSSNILVTVSANPTVDQLSAALGLTLVINKFNKHATAIFSGDIPPAITFLDPSKTFESTVDSLRDFIVALDKEKADHLRYKVEGDVVKIFITPYRTTISEKDLEFSQGDYNVEFVIALGVEGSDDLDTALKAHGRILHDATVSTVSLGDVKSELGTINWKDANSSSYSEMIAAIADGLKKDKNTIDEQVATALLTGIVAATDRFSNNKTSSRVMTVAAQLMGAGANQQLIAAKLEEANAISDSGTTTPEDGDAAPDEEDASSFKVDRDDKSSEETTSHKKTKKSSESNGALAISHERTGDLDEVADQIAEEDSLEAVEAAQDHLAETTKRLANEQQDEAADEAEQQLSEHLAGASQASGAASDVADELKSYNEQPIESAPPEPEPPVLSANHAIITPDDKPIYSQAAFSASTDMARQDERIPDVFDYQETDIKTPGSGHATKKSPHIIEPLSTPEEVSAVPSVSAVPGQTLADLDKEHRGKESDHEEARAAIAAALDAGPDQGGVAQTDNLPPLPPDPATVSEPVADAVAEFIAPSPEPVPAPVSGPLPELPPLPPLPDFSTLPPLPGAPGQSSFPGAAPTPAPVSALELNDIPTPPQPPAGPADPGQFRIPNQS